MSVHLEWFPVVREDSAQVGHQCIAPWKSLSMMPISASLGIGSDGRTQARPSIIKPAPRER